MYNPMTEYQRNQLNQMGMPQQQFSPYPQNAPQFVVRKVGSVEEARGFPIDIGTTYIFPDTGTGRIYLKRLNTDNGKSDFYTYGVAEGAEPTAGPMAQINDRLTNIERMIGGVYGKPVPGDAGNAEPVAGHDGAADGADAGARPAEIRTDTADGRRKR